MDFSSLIDKINISKSNNNDIKYINENINNLNQKEKEFNKIINNEIKILGVGGWGLGDWGLGIGPNPPIPNPNPQSPIPNPQ